MRRKAHRAYRKSGIGKAITGLLVGGVVGATVGWLTAPASGEETRRRLKGDLVGAREKARRAKHGSWPRKYVSQNSFPEKPTR